MVAGDERSGRRRGGYGRLCLVVAGLRCTPGDHSFRLVDDAPLPTAQVHQQRGGQEDGGQVQWFSKAGFQMPMNRVRAISRSVPAPRMKAPTTSREATGRTPTTEVLTDRMKV